MEVSTPQSECLKVAEKILFCLNDTSIQERYLSIKNQIFLRNPQGPELIKHLRKLAIANRNYQNQLEEVKSMAETSDDLTNWMTSQLYALQLKILPVSKTKWPKAIVLEDAYKGIIEVLEAKHKSNEIKRQRLTDENTTYTDKISTLNLAANDDIKKAHKRILENDHRFRQYKKQVEEKLEEIRQEIKELQVKLDDTIDENQHISDSIATKESAGQQLELSFAHLEKKLNSSKKRYKGLKNQVELLQAEIDSRTRDIEAQRAIQRFGIKGADPDELDHLKQIEEQVAMYIETNQQLSLELKKKRLSTNNYEVTEVSKLSYI